MEEKRKRNEITSKRRLIENGSLKRRNIYLNLRGSYHSLKREEFIERINTPTERKLTSIILGTSKYSLIPAVKIL